MCSSPMRQVNPAALERSGIRYGQSSAIPARSNRGSIISNSSARAVTNHIAPEYPDIAQRMGLQGTVQLQAIVRPDGTVKEVHVLGGHSMLTAAAEQIVRRWRYEAANRETVETVNITFTSDHFALRNVCQERRKSCERNQTSGFLADSSDSEFHPSKPAGPGSGARTLPTPSLRIAPSFRE
jgi:TonB family protein